MMGHVTGAQTYASTGKCVTISSLIFSILLVPLLSPPPLWQSFKPFHKECHILDSVLPCATQFRAACPIILSYSTHMQMLPSYICPQWVQKSAHADKKELFLPLILFFKNNLFTILFLILFVDLLNHICSVTSFHLVLKNSVFLFLSHFAFLFHSFFS